VNKTAASAAQSAKCN